MATRLYFRETKTNAIAGFRDMLTAAGPDGTPVGEITTVESATELQWKNNGQTELLEWISGRVPSGGFTLSGTMTFSAWGRESNKSANCGFRARVFKRTAAGVLTEVGGGPFDEGSEFTTNIAEKVWNGSPSSTSFAENDRIVVRIYATNIGTMGGGYVCDLDYDAPDAAVGDSYFQIDETVAFKAEIATVQDSVTANAILLKAQVDAFTADASLILKCSGLFGADVVLLKIQAENFTADTVLKKAKVQADALTVDAVLGKTQTDSFTADAVLVSGQGFDFTADAVLQKQQGHSFTVDGILQQGWTESFTAGAILQKVQVETFSIDAVLLQRQADSFSADAALEQVQPGQFSFKADAILEKEWLDSFTAYAVLLKSRADSVSGDTVLLKGRSGSFGADAFFERFEQDSFTVDAVLLKGQIKSFTSGAVFEKEQTDSFTIDAVLSRVQQHPVWVEAANIVPRIELVDFSIALDSQVEIVSNSLQELVAESLTVTLRVGLDSADVLP